MHLGEEKGKRIVIVTDAKGNETTYDMLGYQGYDGTDYVLRSGTQMTVTYSMIQRVAGRK